MPYDSSSRGPHAAYFEDEESDEEYSTQPLANVAVKRSEAQLITKKASYERRRHGSDSGYSSKTGTNTNDSTSSDSRKAMSDLKSKTTIGERERQPYSRTQPRAEPRRRSSSRPREEAKSQSQEAEVVYTHERGLCQICDRYGKHVEPPLEAGRSSRNPVPPSPKFRQPTPKDDAAVPRVVRRESTTRTARPMTMYDAPPSYQVPYAIAPTANPIHYSTPLSPITASSPYTPVNYTFTPTATVASYAMTGSYFPTTTNTVPQPRPATYGRRSSMYGPPLVNHGRAIDAAPKPLQRTTSHKETRSVAATRRSDGSDQYDGMPPPPRPSERPAEVTLVHRPGIQKSATYNPELKSRSNRRSQQIESEVFDTTAPSPQRDRRHDTSHPPSSYRGPPQESTLESSSRPSARKSASYSSPAYTAKVAASSAKSAPIPRRGTDPTGSDRRLAAAEAYQAKRSSLTSADLTAEALRTFTKRQPSTRSESGSHKSHHTKSSSSAGQSKRTGGGSEIKMNINGVNLSIPAGADEHNINIVSGRDGEVSISLGGKERERRGSDNRSERRNEAAGGQRRIEKAASTTSRGSHRGSVYGASELERERQRQRDREREIEDYERERQIVAERDRYSRSRSRSRGGMVVRERYDEDREERNVWND